MGPQVSCRAKTGDGALYKVRSGAEESCIAKARYKVLYRDRSRAYVKSGVEESCKARSGVEASYGEARSGAKALYKVRSGCDEPSG